MREVGPDASWRTQPLQWTELVEKIVSSHDTINPLLFAPWVNQSLFRKDWLHVCDLGKDSFLKTLQTNFNAGPGLASSEARLAMSGARQQPSDC